MKIFIILITLLSMHAGRASVDPFLDLKPNLEHLLEKSPGRVTIKEIKILANQKNSDIKKSYDNYLLAKKKVWSARARFNPVSAGNLLGIALWAPFGAPYMWGAIAAEAILAVPTKIYNLKKNKYLSMVALSNLYEARRLLNNEIAHLYFDILTHEVILKTIDQELLILNFEQKKSSIMNTMISSLEIERIEIYKLYSEELEALSLLLNFEIPPKIELAQVPEDFDRSLTSNLEAEKLQNFALANSDRYKGALYLQLAAHSNLKQVQWSIISKEALKFSYKRRLQVAKNEEADAAQRVESTKEEVKENVLVQWKKLESSQMMLERLKEQSADSLRAFTRDYESGSEDVIASSLLAIRDFRNRAVAHYQSWSSFDDFSTAAYFDFSAILEPAN